MTAPKKLATSLPVARVTLDLPQGHLDRLFDYSITDEQDVDARPGVRVAVRFAGRNVNGYLIERAEQSDFGGRLLPLRRVVSPLPVLTPEIWRLTQAVAQRYAGSSADVLRLAIPPRHGVTEKAAANLPGALPRPRLSVPPVVSDQAWADYRGGSAFIRHLTAGHAPRAVWTALPWCNQARAVEPTAGDCVGLAPSWVQAIAEAVDACFNSGRGTLVVVPDARDVRRLEPVLRARLEPLTEVARLVAEDGPAARYRSFLAILAGRAKVCIGTRAAAWAPLRDLGLAVIWDDAASSEREPHAPYPAMLQVLALRAAQSRAALLVGAPGRSAEAQRLVESGWAHDLSAARPTVRAMTPRIWVPDAAELGTRDLPGVRLPSLAHQVLTNGLEHGPVLVQVPRAGYLHALSCAQCRSPLRCADCHGPLGLDRGGRLARCRWCGQAQTSAPCGECGGTTWRSVQVGAERTAEEFGQAFPGYPIELSTSTGPRGVLDAVAPRSAVVVSTPGAEPPTAGGYAAAALLDGWLTSSVGGIDASIQALGRWLGAASLVRPASQGGVVVLVGDPAPAPAQALVRWDPVGLAARDLTERHELGLPPAVRMVALTATPADIEAFCTQAHLPPSAQRLGPLPAENGQVRILLRTPLEHGPALVAAVQTARKVWFMSATASPIHIAVDPAQLG